MVFEIADDDPLVELQSDKWQSIVQVLKDQWPDALLMDNWLVTRREWYAKSPEECPFYIYSPEGNPEYGLVGFGRTANRIVNLTIHIQGDDFSKMKNALLKSKKIDWNERPLCTVTKNFGETFKDVLHELGLKINTHFERNCMRILKLDAVKMETTHSSDIYLCPLTEKNLPEVLEVWRHRFPGVSKYVSELIRLNICQGVFSVKENNLFAFCITDEYRFVTAMKTRAGEMSQVDFTSLATRSVTKKIACNVEDVFMLNDPSDTNSLWMFKDANCAIAGSYAFFIYDNIHI